METKEELIRRIVFEDESFLTSVDNDDWDWNKIYDAIANHAVQIERERIINSISGKS